MERSSLIDASKRESKRARDCGCLVLIQVRAYSESRCTSEASARQIGQVRLAWKKGKTRYNSFYKYFI